MKRSVAKSKVSPQKRGRPKRADAEAVGPTPVRREPSTGMASASKMLSLLDAFTVERPTRDVDELAKFYGLTISTIYRYLKLLCEYGLLSSLGNGEYSLGPRAIELDRQIRLSDPLLQLAPPHARYLLGLVEHGVVAIYSLYGDRLISSYQLRKPEALDISYERGRPMGLFRGSAAKVVLANLSRTRLTRIYGEQHKEIKAADMGESLSVFLTKLGEIRRQPIFETAGELDKRSHGFAAPLFDAEKRILGSFNLIIPIEEADKVDHDSLRHAVAREAAAMNAAIQKKRKAKAAIG